MHKKPPDTPGALLVSDQLIGKRCDLLAALLAECRFQGNGRVGERDVLRLLEHGLHDLGCHRRPRAVLDEADRAVLVAALHESVNEMLHEREDLRIIGRRRQNELAVAERILDRLRHVLTRQIRDRDLGAAAGDERLSSSSAASLV